MSFVTNQAFLNTSVMTRLNSQYGVQQANQNLTNMLGNSRQCRPLGSDGSSTLRRENQIMFGSLQDQFRGKCAELNEQSLKAQQDKDIKRTFSYFA